MGSKLSSLCEAFSVLKGSMDMISSRTDTVLCLESRASLSNVIVEATLHSSLFAFSQIRSVPNVVEFTVFVSVVLPRITTLAVSCIDCFVLS
ncbi:hypothetical protein HHK36_028066 [Tetracentron sinense]|uniref:Uncharacterized protein n=1 Tax=Tetracentron sinense TaxID=13715 RepID=A0A835D4Z9_TETSI|nr:hypothetical protein HHK36_028066 [Tetracentron sinense]